MMASHQKGIALIMVLIIIAIGAIVASQLITERNLHARRTSNIILADNAWEFALGAETLAGIILTKNLKNKDSVNLSQAWATEGVLFPIDGGSLAAEIKDLRSCFNLNGILAGSVEEKDEKKEVDANQPLAGEIVFTELVKSLDTDETTSATAVAARLRDWLDSDQRPAGFEGREDYEYSGYAQPYRTGDTLLGGRSELYTISGFNLDLIERLSPYICVIPGVTELVLNINTIKIDQPELLSSFYDKLDVNTAANILSTRPDNGYDQEGYNAQLPAEAKLHEGVEVAFTSPYFELTAKVALGRARISMKSLLHYESQSNDIMVLTRTGLSD
ncbi:MAG: type II secretion system minor pseudopilin GspK [Gammaproteobacteria bacterium]|nr:type II secretion system minor pseudopilin GspK [Gammaproteobacteria bacterium]